MPICLIVPAIRCEVRQRRTFVDRSNLPWPHSRTRPATSSYEAATISTSRPGAAPLYGHRWLTPTIRLDRHSHSRLAESVRRQCDASSDQPPQPNSTRPHGALEQGRCEELSPTLCGCGASSREAARPAVHTCDAFHGAIRYLPAGSAGFVSAEPIARPRGRWASEASSQQCCCRRSRFRSRLSPRDGDSLHRDVADDREHRSCGGSPETDRLMLDESPSSPREEAICFFVSRDLAVFAGRTGKSRRHPPEPSPSSFSKRHSAFPRSEATFSSPNALTVLG